MNTCNVGGTRTKSAGCPFYSLSIVTADKSGMMRPTLLRPMPTSARLWQAGLALSVAIITMAIANQFVAPAKAVTSNMLGLDFLPFYTAGTFVRTGHPERLYDLSAVARFEHQIAAEDRLSLGDDFGPYWNPPFYAWYLAPFSALPYRLALPVWTCVNALALIAAIGLLIGMLPRGTSWQLWALVPLLILVSMPFIQAISHGQNTFTSLLLLCLAVTAWRKRQAVWAGTFCGLLLYKPQLAAVLAVALVLTLGWRSLMGIGSITALLAVVTLTTLPGTATAWLHQLPINLHVMQVEHSYAWERHATLQAFWRMLLQGRSPGEMSLAVRLLTAISIALTAAGLLMVMSRTRKESVDNCWTGETAVLRLDRAIGCTIVATPLLMPFYFDYDLLLLAVPAVLLSGELLSLAPGRPQRWNDRWLVRSWGLLFAVLLVESPLAKLLSTGVIVPALAVIMMLSIARACRRPRMDRSPMVVADEIGQLLQVRRAA